VDKKKYKMSSSWQQCPCRTDKLTHSPPHTCHSLPPGVIRLLRSFLGLVELVDSVASASPSSLSLSSWTWPAPVSLSTGASSAAEADNEERLSLMRKTSSKRWRSTWTEMKVEEVVDGMAPHPLCPRSLLSCISTATHKRDISTRSACVCRVSRVVLCACVVLLHV